MSPLVVQVPKTAGILSAHESVHLTRLVQVTPMTLKQRFCLLLLLCVDYSSLLEKRLIVTRQLKAYPGLEIIGTSISGSMTVCLTQATTRPFACFASSGIFRSCKYSDLKLTTHEANIT